MWGRFCRCVSEDVILSVFLVELLLSKLFLLVYIQEIFLSGSTTVNIDTVFLGFCLAAISTAVKTCVKQV